MFLAVEVIEVINCKNSKLEQSTLNLRCEFKNAQCYDPETQEGILTLITKRGESSTTVEVFERIMG